MTVLAYLFLLATGALVAIWLGYPLVIWFFSKFTSGGANPELVPLKQEPVSVILATRDGPEAVRARLANLLDTDFPDDELQVIVAADAEVPRGSLDSLSRIDRRIRIVHAGDISGKATALNAGVAAADHDLLVMCDTRQFFDRSTIPALYEAMQDRRFGAVSGRLELGGSGTPVHYYWKLERWLRMNEARVHSAVGVTGAVYATRKSLWPQLPGETILDDVYIPMSLVMRGYRAGFSNSARAVDSRVFDDTAEKERKGRTLTGVIQLLKLLPEIGNPLKNPIWVQFVCHKLLRFATPVLAAVAVASAGILYVNAIVTGTAAMRLLLGVPAVGLLVPRIRNIVFTLIRYLYSMQRAVLAGLTNGITGRFDVWRR